MIKILTLSIVFLVGLLVGAMGGALMSFSASMAVRDPDPVRWTLPFLAGLTLVLIGVCSVRRCVLDLRRRHDG